MQLKDGEAVRIAFNGTLIDTHALNTDSFGTNNTGLWATGNAEKLTSLNCRMNSLVQFKLNDPLTQTAMNHQLLYKPGSGAVKIVRQSSDGKGLADTTYSATWSKGWTHFTRLYVGDEPHYFAYKSSTGEVEFDGIDPLGAGVTPVGERHFGHAMDELHAFRRQQARLRCRLRLDQR